MLPLRLEKGKIFKWEDQRGGQGGGRQDEREANETAEWGEKEQ